MAETQCSTQRFCPNHQPTAAEKLCYRCATQKLRQPKSHVFDFIGKFGSGGGTRTPDTRIMIGDGVIFILYYNALHHENTGVLLTVLS